MKTGSLETLRNEEELDSDISQDDEIPLFI